tara:strand:+ start:389 stop:595 length:207 start_codon:yes stop_codon:yes gene_type:complete
MKFNVSEIEFDFDDEGFGYDPLTKEEEKSIIDQTLGVWDVDSENELINKITDTMGWCIKKIDYEVQLK